MGPTAEEIIRDADLSNKTCLITGANSGIGLELTKCLNANGCKVLMACRNTYEASVVAKNCCEKHENINLYELNLASLASVKKCSEKILQNEKKLDIVILNAATFGLPWTLTEDGLETTFQVNYLAQFFFIITLEKILAPEARVVFTSAESHRNIKWPIETMLSPTLNDISLPEKEYTSIKAYNVSKLCGVLAMHYLGYRWLNSNISVFCAHPGSFIKTRLSRNWWVFETLYTSMIPFAKNAKQGASTIMYCATSPELTGLSTLYFKNCRRSSESVMARDSYLSFKIQDLTRDVIRDKVPGYDYSIVKPDTQGDMEKETMEDTLASNYST
ncbi:unnamed protein product [Leptosia nina]|uniref:WW domain-containing oxidoreductase n=1 Tax=Leptosia nina TaxID=320188 RepID=A0AAV1JKI0_9NEOP